MRVTRIVFLAGISAVAGCTLPWTEAAAPPATDASGAVVANATVDYVVDGDTVDVLIDGGEERVRLIGVNTPELAHAASGDRPAQAVECYGAEARDFLVGLLPQGTPVRIERDVVGRDDYGRMLGYVYRAGDGVFVNYELVRQGFARPLSIAPNVAFRERIVEAARLAEGDGAGLWGACNTGG